MCYFVLELQTNGDAGAVISTAYAEREDAFAAAYTLAAVAVKSSVEVHTILCVNSFGFNVIDPMVFDHREKDDNETKV